MHIHRKIDVLFGDETLRSKISSISRRLLFSSFMWSGRFNTLNNPEILAAIQTIDGTLYFSGDKDFIDKITLLESDIIENR